MSHHANDFIKFIFIMQIFPTSYPAIPYNLSRVDVSKIDGRLANYVDQYQDALASILRKIQ